MRLSTHVVLALPLLAAAAESPFEQYKAKFQNFLSSFGAQAPVDNQEAPAGASIPKATKSKIVEKKIEHLTLDNWNQTLFAPVKPDATEPEEWWVLVTGQNKTCFGRCANVETAFKESVPLLAGRSKSPHVAMLNCENETVLCNAWGASAGSLWVFEMVPRPAPIDIYYKRLNLTTTTSETLTDLHAADSKESFKQVDGVLHPYDGFFAQNNLSIPLGYVLWGFNLVPSWAMMLGISLISRTMMNRRMDAGQNRRAAAAAAAGAPRGAPPGDGRS